MTVYLCYTDGACKASVPGQPGGWGFVIRAPDGSVREGFGSATKTLAKVMEYRAVAEALAALPPGARATVFSDNLSLVENLTKKLPIWRTNNFANVDPQVVSLVRRIDQSMVEQGLNVELRWVKSHNGNVNNERADALAAEGARAAKASLSQSR